jgi:hypothetical protein
MARSLTRVILNEVKNLDLSIGSKKRDPSAAALRMTLGHSLLVPSPKETNGAHDRFGLEP